ncbi:hypothetical protein [Saccharopolyspora shandongensis]|uniref:hypothetical protein n=1 Tax=Saccharopolyspora shandongensis TaxID=418495 RepID=UPI0033F810F5
MKPGNRLPLRDRIAQRQQSEAGVVAASMVADARTPTAMAEELARLTVFTKDIFSPFQVSLRRITIAAVAWKLRCEAIPERLGSATGCEQICPCERERISLANPPSGILRGALHGT